MKTKAPTAPAKLKKLGKTLTHLNRHAAAKSLHALLSVAIVRCITEWLQPGNSSESSSLIDGGRRIGAQAR